MPYQSSGGRRNNVQLGVGQSIWAGTPPPAIPERALDGIPGCLTWMALLLSVIGAVAFPRALLVFALAVALYSAFRFLLTGIAAVIGLRMMRRWEKIDWYRALPQDRAAGRARLGRRAARRHHPQLQRAGAACWSRTLENLARQYEAKQRITIVLAMEAAEDGCIEKADCLRTRVRRALQAYLPHRSPARPAQRNAV